MGIYSRLASLVLVYLLGGYTKTMRKNFSLAILGIILAVSPVYSINLAITSDADYYLYYGTYNSTRTPLYIGVNELTTGSPYQYHFNVAGIEINDISNFNIGDTGLLKLNLQRFRVPVAVDPNYQGPPSYQFLTSGVTFTIKAVALADTFSNIETSADPLAWYNANLLSRPALDTVTFNQAGEIIFDITTALNTWKIDPLSNHGIGLIGTYSSVQGTTAQFYSSEYLTDVTKLPAVGIIPEPTIVEFIIAGIFVILVLRFFNKE